MIIYAIIVLITILVVFNFLIWQPNNGKDFYVSRPLWFAHRGALLTEPENTLASFKTATAMGIPAIEVDVMSTKDDIVIASHNFDLERKTDGFGYINEKNYHDLENINVIGPIDSKTESITMLDKILDATPERIRINIEIKTAKWFDFKTVIKVVKIIRKRNLQKRVIISSFNPLVLLAVKLMPEKILTGLIIKYQHTIPLAHVARPDFIHPRGDLVSTNFLRYARKKRLGINVWTVNTKPAINWLFEQGVEGVITDRLEYFRS